MKDKYIEVEINKIINRYSKILLLHRHTIEIKYKKDMDATAECVFNYPYLNITINYGDNLKKKFDDNEDIKPYIIHELCHPITDPLYCKATARYVSKDEILDERELLTDYICNIIVKLNL